MGAEDREDGKVSDPPSLPCRDVVRDTVRRDPGNCLRKGS